MELNSGLTAFADNQSDGSKSHIERYHRYDFDTKEESIEEIIVETNSFTDGETTAGYFPNGKISDAQSHHSAQAGRTPRACCIVANQVQLAVPGYCRIRPRWQGSQWQWQSHQRTGLPLGWCPYYSAKNVLFENYSGQKFDFVSFECPL